MNFYPFHIGDYSAHTKHLSLMEDLAYRRMLDLYYTSESPLPIEPERVARLIGMRDYLQEVTDVLSDFFVKSDEGHISGRCDKEIEAYQAKADRAKSANKARWSSDKSNNRLKSDVKPDKKTDVISDADLIPTKNQEPITKNQELKEKPNVNPTVEDEPSTDRRAPPKRDDSLAVFEHWQGVMGHRTAKLDAKRVKAIKGRLKDGYTVDDLCRAIDGCKLSPHHQGKNDAGTIYDDIELICRDGPHVDNFRKIAERGAPSQPKKSFAEQINERVNRGTGQKIIDLN